MDSKSVFRSRFSRYINKSEIAVAALSSALLLTCFAGQALAGEIVRLKAAGDTRLVDESQSLAASAKIRGMMNFRDGDEYFVVQFKGPISPEDHQALTARGLEVRKYLPDDALVVKGKRQIAASLHSFAAESRAVVSYRPEWKISEELQGAPAQTDLLISLFDEEISKDVIAHLEQIPGVTVRSGGARDLVVQADLSRLDSISSIEGIEWIQAMPRIVDFTLPMAEGDQAQPPHGLGQYTGYESGTKIMHMDSAWNRGFRGQGQIASMSDTGLDLGQVATIHPDFAGNLLKGYAVGLGGTSWEDPQGHGTHVAGSIVGNGTASQGRFRGSAFGAQFLAEGLWSPILDNLAPGSDLSKIFGPVYRDGARIHSNSWGNPNSLGQYDAMAARVDDFMWNNPDMLILFAAGNSGVDANRDGHVDTGSVSSPSTAKNCLTVGASENLLATGGIQRPHGDLRDGAKNWGVEPLKSDTLSNNPNGLAVFSSRGPTTDGRIKPEIVAPGTNIVSVASRHPKASKLWGAYDENYVYAGGTSMATPLTAGASTVARGYLVDNRKIANPSAALVKATMLHTAFDLYPGQYGTGPQQEIPTRRPNVHEGYGRVDMDTATKLSDETVFVDDRTGLGLNEQKEITVDVAQGANFRATLTYTDAPAAASATKSLVNDLDLKVITPAGETVTLNDHKNNTEMVELFSAKGGTYRVIVTGANVPTGKNGKQPYALIVSSGI